MTTPAKRPGIKTTSRPEGCSKPAASQQPEYSRRQFAGVTSAVLGLGASSLIASSPARRKVRIGVVGGRFGLGFQFHEHPDCIVEAVSDLLPDRRAQLMKTYRCQKSYDSLEELVLDRNIDAVAIFTDGPLHTKHVAAAMRHGKHALSAVPAAWGTLEDCHFLLDTVKKFGLTYMMCETGYYQPEVMAARQFFTEGQFGELFDCESEYQHPGIETLSMRGNKRTWRYGMAPMYYPTHNTAKLISVTGERLTQVSCYGWGDDSQVLKDNAYQNPFWNETALFRTDHGHAFRLKVWWSGAFRFAQRADWVGSKMSLHMEQANGQEPMIVRLGKRTGKDGAGYAVGHPRLETFQPPVYWKTDRLPEPLRHNSGHWGSHCFLTHEFIDSLVKDRQPAIDLYEALAYTVPGIVAHQSALQGGQRLPVPRFDPPT